MKITNATTLRELQQLVCVYELIIHVDWVNSAAAYRATVGKFTGACGIAIGSTLGEAVASALAKYEEKIK